MYFTCSFFACYSVCGVYGDHLHTPPDLDKTLGLEEKKQDEVGERNAMEYEQNMGIAIIFRKGLSILVLVSALYEFGGPFWVAMLLDHFYFCHTLAN